MKNPALRAGYTVERSKLFADDGEATREVEVVKQKTAVAIKDAQTALFNPSAAFIQLLEVTGLTS